MATPKEQSDARRNAVNVGTEQPGLQPGEHPGAAHAGGTHAEPPAGAPDDQLRRERERLAPSRPADPSTTSSDEP